MRDVAAGFGYLVKGQRWVGRHPRWFWFGLIPALITLVGYLAALVALAFWADDVVSWATPFADGWPSPWLGAFRGALDVLFFCGCLVVAVISFTSVALLVGEPFFESLSERVDLVEGGGAPESGRPFWRELLVSARDSVAIMVRGAVWGVLLFALGLLPVVGQTVVPVLGCCVSGFFLTEELTSIALARRGVALPERLRLLRARKPLVLGFGVPLTLLFLLPLVAVFFMPGAVAGATLLVRDLTGEARPAPGETAVGDASWTTRA